MGKKLRQPRRIRRTELREYSPSEKIPPKKSDLDNRLDNMLKQLKVSLDRGIINQQEHDAAVQKYTAEKERREKEEQEEPSRESQP